MSDPKNLRKLSFVGFGRSRSNNKNDASLEPTNEDDVHLDEECAKVFAMDVDNDKFDLDRFHDDNDDRKNSLRTKTEPRQYTEKEFSLHRKRSYPHMHVPLKASKSIRRRTTSPHLASLTTMSPLPSSSSIAAARSTIETASVGRNSSAASSYVTLTPSTSSIKSPAFKTATESIDDVTTTSSSSTLQKRDDDDGVEAKNADQEEELDEVDESEESAESECVFSDPIGLRYANSPDPSPDRKVQFVIGGCSRIDDVIPEDETKESDVSTPPVAGESGSRWRRQKRKARHHHQHHHPHHSKFRKYSLPEDASTRKHYHYHHHPERNRNQETESNQQQEHQQSNSHSNNKGRRISTQPEDLPLTAADRDQLESHRSDDNRALRRMKFSRPSIGGGSGGGAANNVPSTVHIGRRDGGDEMNNVYFKKMYDHSPHAIFVELDELFDERGVEQRGEWKETARWIKYEEDVEEGVDRWGKPHVASLSFHSLLNLRKCLEDGVVCLDMEERDLPAIAYRIAEELYKEDLILEEDKSKIMRLLLLRHRHVNTHHHHHHHHHSGSAFRFPKKHSYTSLQNLQDFEKRKTSFATADHTSMTNGKTESDGRLVKTDTANRSVVLDMKEETLYSTSNEEINKRTQNDAILKRIPGDAQASSVLVGCVDFLRQPAMAFVRLAEGVVVPSLVEVNIPVRFIFLLLGPKLTSIDYHEVGRSISTLMANQQFHSIAYSADNRKALLSAINEFLDDSIVLPPGDWERQALLPIEEIKSKSEAIKRRKLKSKKSSASGGDDEGKPLLAPCEGKGLGGGDDGSVGGFAGGGGGGGGGKKPPYPNPLERTRKPWGGLINDIRRRYPHFRSDFRDGLNAQCAAAAIFMYFAALSGAITFGGLMSDKTDNLIGISETLVATAFAGIVFALLSGQPLVIVGSTGPLLLFDESLYQFCKSNGLDYLIVRVYIGLWLGAIALGVALFEGSVLVKLFSRFTEEIFSALISLLYIVESVMKLVSVFGQHPLLAHYCGIDIVNGYNLTDFDDRSINFTTDASENESFPVSTTVSSLVLAHNESNEIVKQPNTALFCTILALGTFAIAYYLRLFRNSQFLGRNARRALGDFGVPIAIVIMVALDYMVPQTYTEKLSVPSGLSPSDPEVRGWIISPGEGGEGSDNDGNATAVPLWIVFAAAVPAMLVYILLFMETHISELIIDKKERKLKKGSGFHLDIVLLCALNVGCGFLGAPWMCAATVRSVAHVSAVTVMSRTHAPGEKPHIIEVKEQRITSLTVATLVGLSVLMAPLLQLVPMSVLFGVFLYMGVSSTDGIQFFERIRLFFMPVKHHPQASYVRRVKTIKMHIFTAIQLACLIILWIVKSTKASLAFPFVLILMVPLRAQLKHFFTSTELRALDGDQPDVDDDEPDFYAEAPLPG